MSLECRCGRVLVRIFFRFFVVFLRGGGENGGGLVFGSGVIFFIDIMVLFEVVLVMLVRK